MRDIREWIGALRRAGELVAVSAEVDPHLEITEISDRVMKAGGPALLFERVKGSALPVLINAFGSERRTNLALQVPSVETLAEERVVDGQRRHDGVDARAVGQARIDHRA